MIVDGVKSGLHWDAEGGHGDGLGGAARDRVVMFAGTGSTRGWEGWLTKGRRRHSLGEDDRTWGSAETTEAGSSPETTELDEECESDRTFVGEGKKDL